jgi:MipA family protein
MDNRMNPILATHPPMCLPRQPLASLLLLLAVPAALAAPSTEPEAALGPAPEVEEPHLEGAIGLNVSYGPTYLGSGQSGVGYSPGFFLRWGRFTITNASGYVTKRSDDIFRGLGVDVVRSEQVRVNLSLRIDGGRGEDADPALAGMGDIEKTVRARISGTWRLKGDWRLGGSWNIDALGHGGGSYGDVSFARDMRWSPETTWSWGASLSAAVRRYMLSHFGVNDEQSAASGYPVYQPGNGLRDVAAFANVRTELSARWVALGSVSVSRLIGPPVDSPLTKEPLGWGVNASLAWLF